MRLSLSRQKGFSSKLAVVIGTAAILLDAPQIQAAGFEKSIFWSGHYAGMAGAASSSVSGAEALFFNPAGLAGGGPGGSEVSLNFSSALSKFSGPITSATPAEGNRTFSPTFGALASYRINERFGIGAGSYVAGGASSEIANVDWTSFNPPSTSLIDTLKPTHKMQMSLIELSAGAGYSVTEELKLGLAWRASFVRADFSTSSPVAGPGGSTAAVVALNLSDLKATRYSGWRLGAQYEPKDSFWSAGISLRTPVSFVATGTGSGLIETATASSTATPIAVSDTSVASEFPLQASFGTRFWLNSSKTWQIIPEYVFTRYAVVQGIDVGGKFNAGSGDIEIPDIQTAWNNQHNLRLGGECFAVEGWSFRAGYVYTSQVTRNEFARATFTPPGPSHTFTLGTGTRLWGEKVRVDAAIDFTTSSGEGSEPWAQQPTLAKSGSYGLQAFLFHFGTTYGF